MAYNYQANITYGSNNKPAVNSIPRINSVNGNLVKESVAILDDAGNLSGLALLSANGITAVAGNITASAGSISASSGLSVSAGGAAISGNSTLAGNLSLTTSGTGLVFTPVVASGAAGSPLVLNGRVGLATFTGPSIAAGATQVFTITNSAITGSGTRVLITIFGATTGSALSVQGYVPSAGSLAITAMNGTGATTTTADITFTFIVLN